jgi:nanoRNase/pAp phosphatase (c-di-AMP/oligoRNAs hydrolase)
MSLNTDQQIYQSINNSKNILLLVPVNYNGDCLSAVLAFYNYLLSQTKGDNIDFILPQKAKKIYSFLPGIRNAKLSFDHIRRLVLSINTSNTKVNKIDYTQSKDNLNIFINSVPTEINTENVKTFYDNYYDLIIIFKSPDLKSLGEVFSDHPDFFHQTPIINIDNQASNERYGQINFVDLKVNSLSEQVFNFFIRNNLSITPEIATCLLAGLISSTKGFSNKKVTPRALEIASKLIELGADREQVIENLYQTKSISLLRVWGQILSDLNYDEENKIAWSALKTDDDELEIDDLIEELISKASQAEIIVLFKIKAADLLKVYIHSNNKHNSFELIQGLAERLDILGDEDLLSFDISGFPEETKYKILSLIKENIKFQKINK